MCQRGRTLHHLRPRRLGNRCLEEWQERAKRFFCLPCVREKQEQGEARGIVGATQFLNKHKQ